MPISVAGFFGYMAGKLSYMKTCQEKFKRLENSPLGEALRQRTGLPSQRWAPHAFLDCCVCVHQVRLHCRFLCSLPALQVLSQNWVTLTLNRSSRCSSHPKPAARIAISQNQQSQLGGQMILRLQASTKVLLRFFFFLFKIIIVSYLQLSHTLKRSPEGRASSMRT